jgi:branched-chain amino acid transport system permease protein
MPLNIFIEAFIGGLLTGGIYGVIALGLTLIFGILRVINFAHGEFLMIGMYISYFSCTILGINPYLSLLIVIPIVFLLGVLCEILLIKPVLNSPEEIQILLTFGLVLVFQNLALLFWTSDLRNLSSPLAFKLINISGISLRLTTVIAFLISITLSIFLYIFLKKTDFGKAIRACSEQKEGALFCGLKINKIYCLTFGLGITLSAIPGALILPTYSVSPFIGLSFTLPCFIIIVLGGLGSAPGALLGGIIVGVAESFSSLLLPGSLQKLVTYVLFIAVVCFKPSGLFGAKKKE